MLMADLTPVNLYGICIRPTLSVYVNPVPKHKSESVISERFPKLKNGEK